MIRILLFCRVPLRHLRRQRQQILIDLTALLFMVNLGVALYRR